MSNQNKIRNDIFGWFNDTDCVPTHDPGLEVNCVICGKPLSLPVKTISLMVVGDMGSYFYRTHKECYEQLDEKEISAIEGSLIDIITNRI